MDLARTYGVLLHPTSLAGPWGIGVLGKEARRFLDWLARARAGYWQVLPLGATGLGECPYLGVSAWAGNPYLIDPEDLFARGWLARENPPPFPVERVDFPRVMEWKWGLLRRAFSGFEQRARPSEQTELMEFMRRETRWLDDYTLFMALFFRHDRESWSRWPEPLRRRDPEALAEARRDLKDEIRFHAFTQWLFFQQWEALRRYGAERGVRIIGDVPIFVSYQSAEVWANPDLFFLDERGEPTVVGGVPPDYFSPEGQRWGNPLYRWDKMEQRGFDFWIDRVRTVLGTCDLIRIDHFRAFESYWEILASEPTAKNGRWVKAPGDRFFSRLKELLGDLPFIAEDLGIITDEVYALRDRFRLPGMKVLQFAFGNDAKNPHLPENFPEDGHCVVYPGTHDNDTLLGWWRTLPETERAQALQTLHAHRIRVAGDNEIGWAFIRLAFHSRARLAVVTLQDILGLGSESRMNNPATSSGNWGFRYLEDALQPKLATRLGRLAEESQRASPFAGPRPVRRRAD